MAIVKLKYILHFSRDSLKLKQGGAEKSTELFFETNLELKVRFANLKAVLGPKFIVFRFDKLIYFEAVLLYVQLNFYLRFRAVILEPGKSVSCHSTFVPLLLKLVKENAEIHYVFFRSEYDFYRWRNYNYGLKKYLKIILNLFELPFGLVYNLILRNELNNSRCKVIVNSNFMKNEVHAVLAIDSEVHLPIVKKPRRSKFSELDSKAQFFLNRPGPTFIVFAYEIVKGKHIVDRMRKKLVNYNFIVVDRTLKEPQLNGNSLFLPHQKQNINLMYHVDFVLIPSQWNEAYGRVCREAELAGVSAIASNVGGLPEAGSSGTHFIDDYTQPKKWLKTLQK